MEDILYRACLVFALPTMSIIALVSLVTWRGRRRKQLGILSAFFIGGLALLVGGSFVLGRNGLAWRTLPLNILMVVIMISGVVGLVFLTAIILSMPLPDLAPVLHVLFKLVTIACASLLLYFALTIGFILFIFSVGETDRVVEYQGENGPERLYFRLTETFSRLAVGSKGEAVSRLQRRLIALGYLAGEADGDFGEATAEAVKVAQAVFGMPETGIATPEFQERLFE